MLPSKLLAVAILAFAVTSVQAKAEPAPAAAPSFTCTYDTDAVSSDVAAYLQSSCDLTKPFSASVVDGATAYAQEVLICCTGK